MEDSKIAWTNHTFNGVIGCSHVSPGCVHCYAETQNKYYKWNGGIGVLDRRARSPVMITGVNPFAGTNRRLRMEPVRGSSVQVCPM